MDAFGVDIFCGGEGGGVGGRGRGVNEIYAMDG